MHQIVQYSSAQRELFVITDPIRSAIYRDGLKVEIVMPKSRGDYVANPFGLFADKNCPPLFGRIDGSQCPPCSAGSDRADNYFQPSNNQSDNA